MTIHAIQNKVATHIFIKPNLKKTRVFRNRARRRGRRKQVQSLPAGISVHGRDFSTSCITELPKQKLNFKCWSRDAGKKKRSPMKIAKPPHHDNQLQQQGNPAKLKQASMTKETLANKNNLANVNTKVQERSSSLWKDVLDLIDHRTTP